LQRHTRRMSMAERRPAGPKVTYATLAAGQTPEFNKAFDDAVEKVRKDLGRTYPMLVGGREVSSRETFADTCPADTRVLLGRFQSGTRGRCCASLTRRTPATSCAPTASG